MKKINFFKFLLPTQLLIQKQWWSYLYIHILHISQWRERGGFRAAQDKQTFFILILPFRKFINFCGFGFLFPIIKATYKKIKIESNPISIHLRKLYPFSIWNSKCRIKATNKKQNMKNMGFFIDLSWRL